MHQQNSSQFAVLTRQSVRPSVRLSVCLSFGRTVGRPVSRSISRPIGRSVSLYLSLILLRSVGWFLYLLSLSHSLAFSISLIIYLCLFLSVKIVADIFIGLESAVWKHKHVYCSFKCLSLYLEDTLTIT